jgi:hypothetical protein
MAYKTCVSLQFAKCVQKRVNTLSTPFLLKKGVVKSYGSNAKRILVVKCNAELSFKQTTFYLRSIEFSPIIGAV